MTNPLPGPVLQSQTQKGFLSLQLITQSCHAVLNTQFVTLDPKPSWFDTLKKNLDDAQAVATDWIDNIAPAVTASVPQTLLDYGTTYQAITEEIVSICTANPNASGADNLYVKQVQSLIEGLLQQIVEILATVDTTGKQLKDWGDRLQKAHDALDSGTDNIQRAESSLQTDIDAMNTAIASLQSKISRLNTKMMYGQMGLGVGLFVLVVGIALTPVSGGAGMAVGAAGLAGIVLGSVAWGVFQSEINDDFSKIAADQTEKDADKAQIVALKSLGMATTQAVSNMARAESALSEFRTSWAGLHDDLQGVINDLTNADKALSTLLQEAFTNAAANEWAMAVSFATALQQTEVESSVVSMDMNGQITGQAAAA